jgi:hypothetical protein
VNNSELTRQLREGALAASIGLEGVARRTGLWIAADRIDALDAALKATENGLTIADYEEVLADHRRLVRELDVLINGEAGAAKQASLCDIVSQVAIIKRYAEAVSGSSNE